MKSNKVRFGRGYFIRAFTRGNASLRISIEVPTSEFPLSGRVEVEILAPTEAEARGAIRRWRGLLEAQGIRRDAHVEVYSSDPAPFRCCDGRSWGYRCARCHGRWSGRQWALLRMEG